MAMILYHGSNQDFEAFDVTRSNGMIWLTDTCDYAAEFGTVKAYRVALNNPLDMSSYTQELALEQWQAILNDLGIDTDSIDWSVVDFAPDYGYYWLYDLLPHAGNNYANGGTLQAIKDAGYDGIIAPEESCQGITSAMTYVAFSAQQVVKVDG